MKNKTKSFIFVPLVLFAVPVVFLFSKNNNKNVSEQNKQSEIINSIENTSKSSLNETAEPRQEVELSNFSTNLAGDENRLENIRLSCNTINGTTLKNGESFSFNDIIGEPTEDKGYKQADVLVDTELTKDFGGGNCQVSTTLYNACLNTPGIEVTERHPHKKQVAYVEEGKDASVSFGVLDLKFTNNTGSTIKIYMDSENEKVTARIVKV